MRSKIFLSDSAEVREGLLFVLGGGWNQVGPAPQPFTIAGLLEVDWDEANTRHVIEFAIDDEDGNPLMVPSAMGPQPFRLTHHFEIGRPPGAARGTSFNVPVAIPLPAIPWTPGHHYVLIVRINTDERDRVRFSIRAAGAALAPQVP